jgi:dihydrofolate reductase/thymidylate synthase
MEEVEVVVAAAYRSRGIGWRGGLPWKLSADLRRFAALTSACESPLRRNVVVMGRGTWESIPEQFRPLRNRVNIVLSRSLTGLPELSEGRLPSAAVVRSRSIRECMAALRVHRDQVHKIFVIGGAALYRQAFEEDVCCRIHFTQIFSDFECDTFFPEINLQRFVQQEASEIMFEDKLAFQYVTYERLTPQVSVPAPVRHEELQYLDLIREVIETGVQRGDRTNTGTLAVFGRQMRFSLRHNVFPLLTTKRVFWRGVAEELFWFIAGCTDASKLQEKGIKVLYFDNVVVT